MPQSRPDLFPPESVSQIYTAERFHLMGSRILSRSFHVLRFKPEGEDADEEAEVDEAEASATLNGDGNAMDVDAPADAADEPAAQVAEEALKEADEQEDEEEDEDRYEDPADVAMVPMADMLNGRFNTETVSAVPSSLYPCLTSRQARLFYDDAHVLKFVTIREIASGEQIVSLFPLPATGVHMHPPTSRTALVHSFSGTPTAIPRTRTCCAAMASLTSRRCHRPSREKATRQTSSRFLRTLSSRRLRSRRRRKRRSGWIGG